SLNSSGVLPAKGETKHNGRWRLGSDHSIRLKVVPLGDLPVQFLACFLAAILLSPTARSHEPSQAPAEVVTTVNRGLAFLASDAVAWRNEHKCVSCHHAALVVWSMSEAKDRGYKVDESLLADFTKWTAESGDGKTGVPRPKGLPKALNTKA